MVPNWTLAEKGEVFGKEVVDDGSQSNSSHTKLC